MKQHETPRLPELGEILSRDGVRGAVRRAFKFFGDQKENENSFRRDVIAELNFSYAELDETPGLLADQAQRIVTVNVPDAILGYAVDATYSQDLQGLVMGVPYVSAAGVVKIVLANFTGAGVTLAPGRWRIYVKPRVLSS